MKGKLFKIAKRMLVAFGLLGMAKTVYASLFAASRQSKIQIARFSTFLLRALRFGNNLRYCSRLPAVTRCSRKKWLFVSDCWVPEHDKNTGARCSREYLELFAELGFGIVFVPLDRTKRQPYLSEIESLGIIVIFPYDAVRWLSKNIGSFDYFYLQRPISLELLRFIRDHKKSASTVIYYDHDLHYLRMRRQALLFSDEKALVESNIFEKMEDEIFHKADIVYVAGEFEQKIVSERVPDKNVRAVPGVLFELEERSRPVGIGERKDIMYIGGYGHRPNVDAVLWFLDNVWMHVHDRVPDWTFHIVGSDPDKSFYDGRYANVNVAGRVSDEELLRLYGRVRLMVAPIRYGAGVKGKILEAMDAGLPVITTPIGAEGIVDNEKYMAIVGEAAEWRTALPELYMDESRLERMAVMGKSIINRFYTYDSVKRVILEDMPL